MVTSQTVQALTEVAPIALVAWITLALAVAACLAWSDRAQCRHARDRHPALPEPLVVQQPRPRHRTDYAATAAPIEMPTPRPYTGGIPVLVVEGPPSTRGTQPAPGLPVERRTFCSLCRDGEVILAGTGECPWCGAARTAVAS